MPGLGQMGTKTGTGASAEALRAALASQLRKQGAIRSVRVAAAFGAVPRHVFAPGVPLARAYANDTIITKRDKDGAALSSISAPWVQATMLEQAQLGPGMRVLEIGSGGYNAALIAALTGETGEVTTVDIDPEVTSRTSRCLAEAGYARINVVLGDADDGVKDRAPYDRIIVTAGAWDIPPAWTGQLAPGGRLVVPLRLRGLTRSVAFDRDDGHLASRNHAMCGFVPMQGAGARAERLVRLHGDDVALRVDDSQQIDAAGLRAALLQPREETWSGVRFGGSEPFDALFLWLGRRRPRFWLLPRQPPHPPPTPSPPSPPTAAPTPVDPPPVPHHTFRPVAYHTHPHPAQRPRPPTDPAGTRADPSPPPGTPTLIDARSFAYHTSRQVDDDTYEFGAYAHGPQAAYLAAQMTDCIRAWDSEHREALPQIAVYPAGTPENQLPPGCLIAKRHTRITISWP